MSSPPQPPRVSGSAAVDPPPGLDTRRWGLGEMWLGLGASIVASALAAGIALDLGGWVDIDSAPLWVTAVLTLVLEGAFFGVSSWAAVTKGLGPIKDFAIRTVSSDVGIGVLVGVLTQLVLVPAVTFPILWLTGTDADEVSRSAAELTDRATTPVGLVALILTVGFTAPIVEEIFFRGLAFGAFKKRRNFAWLEQLLPEGLSPDTTSQRWNTGVAFVMSSLIFGLFHLQPILIPALSLVGAVFAWLAHRYGRLGPAIWAHAAFNGTTLLNLLVL